jgi:mxaJ protein
MMARVIVFLFLMGAVLGTVTSFADDKQPPLRVCADPNNLPFSNVAGEGFENRLAQLVGDALGERVEYTWWAQRRGFIRNTLKAGRCDVVMGVPSDYGMALTTQPYYRSSYVLVYRHDRNYRLRSLDDPRLQKMKIGIHVMGSDNPPPAIALARRGMVDNVIGYSLYGDYREANPPARLIDAVARGDVNVAIAWGPLAGYFAQQDSVALDVVPLPDNPAPLPFRFSISMGVRRGDEALRDRLDAVLRQKRPEIDALLQQYGVPLVGDAPHVASANH